MDEQEGTAVAKGNHIVPKGVAVEELDGGKRKLAHKCPPDLEDLLLRTECLDVYDKLVKAVVEAGSTRSPFGKWRDKEFDAIINIFRDEFAAKGIKVVLCKRKSGAGKFRWLEFIDTHLAPEGYVPQFDVANMSGQVIRTCYTKLEFPNGVAVEELQRYGNARRTLKEKIPVFVEDMLGRKGLLSEYESMVDDLVNSDAASWCKQGWKEEHVYDIMNAHKGNFEKNGVALFLGYKREYISHGQYGGHFEHFRWMEFVDREEQPNYYPQRDIQVKQGGNCIVS